MARNCFEELGFPISEPTIALIFDYPETGQKYRLSVPRRFYEQHSWHATMPLELIQRCAPTYYSNEWYHSLPELPLLILNSATFKLSKKV